MWQTSFNKLIQLISALIEFHCSIQKGAHV